VFVVPLLLIDWPIGEALALVIIAMRRLILVI
jgi:hypothetical protein